MESSRESKISDIPTGKSRLKVRLQRYESIIVGDSEIYCEPPRKVVLIIEAPRDIRIERTVHPRIYKRMTDGTR